MLRPEMKLFEHSEFSSQALLLIRFQILYFSQIPEWNKDPASRISVPFYPGNSEYFLVFLNSGSFRQIRIVNYYENVKKVLIFYRIFIIIHYVLTEDNLRCLTVVCFCEIMLKNKT